MNKSVHYKIKVQADNTWSKTYASDADIVHLQAVKVETLVFRKVFERGDHVMSLMLCHEDKTKRTARQTQSRPTVTPM